MPNSTRRKRKPADRPKKPYADFPMYAHALGYWSAKVSGRIVSFGRWGRIVKGKMTQLPYEASWRDALATFNARIGDARSGKIRETVVTTQPASEGVTVGDLRVKFLTAKSRQLDAKEITPRTYAEYRAGADTILKSFGERTLIEHLTADDFEKLRAQFVDRFGPVTLAKAVQLTRTMFKYGYESGLIDKPVRFGPQFKKPSASVMRRHRASSGKKLFTAEEIGWLLDGKPVKGKGSKTERLDGATPQMRAMILLGINCGFGNSDVADLTNSVVDLKRGWIEFPRPKTGIERRCALWPETVDAVKAALAVRPQHKVKADADCIFITKQGNRWVRVRVNRKEQGEGEEARTTAAIMNSVGMEFGKVLKRLGINGRKGLGFYSLRHSFRTVADATKDFPAIRLIMGHADGSIDNAYREGIDDDRLLAVTAHVRKWLLGDRVK